jgi:formiminoglutamase
MAEFWNGDVAALQPGRAVLLGFPTDEGVRRNHGRPGAAAAPDAIRPYLYRLTPWDATTATELARARPLDLGNLRVKSDLEASQQALGEVLAAVLQAGAVPIVLGGGHETAYGHYLGYVKARQPVAILNLDAHLDVRPLIDGRGHSGSPFRQALEHPDQPLSGPCYTCLGAQPWAVAGDHLLYVREKGCSVHWQPDVRDRLRSRFAEECRRLTARGHGVYFTVDADVVQCADVPGVSAPNPLGLSGAEVASCARLAGASPAVSSFDLVEVNPSLDRDGQSARWAALTVWHFLAGLAERPVP